MKRSKRVRTLHGWSAFICETLSGVARAAPPGTSALDGMSRAEKLGFRDLKVSGDVSCVSMLARCDEKHGLYFLAHSERNSELASCCPIHFSRARSKIPSFEELANAGRTVLRQRRNLTRVVLALSYRSSTLSRSRRAFTGPALRPAPRPCSSPESSHTFASFQSRITVWGETLTPGAAASPRARRSWPLHPPAVGPRGEGREQSRDCVRKPRKRSTARVEPPQETFR